MESTMNMQRKNALPRSPKPQQGFSLIEVMMSIVVLTVGLVSLLGVFGIAMASTQTSALDMMAKQLANEAMETLYSARDTNNIQWEAIQNNTVTNADLTTGIFLPGFQNIYWPGGDGILGTADDAAAGRKTLTPPGPDGTYGNAVDVAAAYNLSNYQRQIVISNNDLVNGSGALPGNLRSYVITIQYTTPQFKLPKQYVLAGYISQYR
jgi:prepilin-type N-terminal cleavage/methylation domain-containing protein